MRRWVAHTVSVAVAAAVVLVLVALVVWRCEQPAGDCHPTDRNGCFR